MTMVDSTPDSASPKSGWRSSGGTFAPFSFPAFRAIWVANLFSNIGSMIQSVGAAWLMTELTTSHRLIAMVQASATLPIMLFGVFAGAIADNFDRRRVMLIAQIGMLIVSAVLALVTAKGLINPEMLLSLTLLVGIGTALNAPAWQASVRAQVGPKDLPQAITLNSVAFNLARSAGPAIGGLLISLWDISFAFAVNALSYTILIVVLLRWQPQLPQPVRRPILRSILVGLQFCASSVPVRRVLIRSIAVGFGFAGFLALLPVIVRTHLGGTEIDFGLLLASFGGASIIGALMVGPVRRTIGTELVIGIGTIAFVIAELMLATSLHMAVALPAAFIGGVGWVTTLTTLNVAMQLRSPEEILGRCLSIYQAALFGGMAIGAWTWGAIADWQGSQLALILAATWLAFSLVLLRIIAPMPQRGEGIHHGNN
jgi:MFS family permease